MNPVHEVAVPKLHGRLHELRLDLEAMRALAVELAEALDGEVDLRHGARTDDLRVGHRSGAALRQARRRGLL